MAGLDPADHPLHGQGRRRQDVGRCRHGPPLRCGRRAHAPSSRPTPRTRSPSRSSSAVAGEPTEVGGGLWAQQVQAQEELEQNWSAVQKLARRRAGRARRRADRRRGAHRAAGRRRAVQPAPAQAPRGVRRVGHDRGRLRADRRDAAAALVPDAARWWLDRVLGRENALPERRTAARARLLRPLAARRARDGGLSSDWCAT